MITHKIYHFLNFYLSWFWFGLAVSEFVKNEEITNSFVLTAMMAVISLILAQSQTIHYNLLEVMKGSK